MQAESPAVDLVENWEVQVDGFKTTLSVLDSWVNLNIIGVTLDLRIVLFDDALLQTLLILNIFRESLSDVLQSLYFDSLLGLVYARLRLHES